jgi:tripartite-type tricarboxylate transporter receptor subunit TctC
MRPLVTYGDKRMSAFPSVPTLKELGYDYVAKSIYLLMAPKGTPAPIVKKLDLAFKKATEDPEFIDYMKKAEIPIAYGSSEEAKKHLEETNKRFAKMIVDLKIPKEQ